MAATAKALPTKARGKAATSKKASSARTKQSAVRLNPVRWQSLRSLRWKRLFQPLRQFMLTGDLPEGLPRKLAARVRKLSTQLMLDEVDGEIYLETWTPFPSDTDKDGNSVVEMREPHRLRLVSEDEIEDIVLETFRAPNLGSFRGPLSIYTRLSRQFLGISRTDVERILAKTETYQITLKTEPKTIVPQLADGPMVHWKIDFMILENMAAWNGGFKYLLNIIDIFSKFAWSFPTKNKSAPVVADLLQRLWLQEGAPEILGCDRDGAFRAETDDVATKFNVEIRRSKAYSSSTQGAVERLNQTLRAAIAKAMGEYGSKKWTHMLPHIVGAYNRAKHKAHGFTPMMAHRRHDQLMPLDVEIDRRLRITAKRMVRQVARANEKRKGTTEQGAAAAEPDADAVRPGDRVKVRLSMLTSAKAKGAIALRAEQKRKGRGADKFTDVVYTVSRVRKRFRDDTQDRPEKEWKYELEGIAGELFPRDALLKLTDGLIRQVGRRNRIELNYGTEDTLRDRKDAMDEGMRKRFDMTQEAVRDEAEAADEEREPAPRVSRRSSRRTARAAAAAAAPRPRRPRAAASRQAVKVGDVFVDSADEAEYTVGEVIKRPEGGGEWQVRTTAGENWSYDYAKRHLKGRRT